MGNCCQKRKNEGFQKKSTDIKNEENNNNILIIKNDGGKNFKENNGENENITKKLNYYDELNSNHPDSNTKFIKPEIINVENDKSYYINSNSKYNKIISKYEKILYNYLKLKENMINKKNMILYIINKKDNDDIISLYNLILANKEYKLLKSNTSDKKKKEIIKTIIYNFILEKKEINSKIKVYNYEECKKNLKNNLIDLVDKDFINEMEIKINKDNETKYIDNYNNDNDNLILEFTKIKKKVRIERRNEQYILREFIDEYNSDIKKSIFDDNQIFNILEFNDVNENKNNINKKENNYLKNSQLNNNKPDEKDKINSLNKIKIDMNKTNNKDEILVEEENKNDILIIIVFKILILYNSQNKNKIIKNNEENLHDSENYHLINKNILINLKNEINNKTNENIDDIINDFILKQKIENFEDTKKNLENIINEFKNNYNNLFRNDYVFSKIKFSELLPNNNEIINQITNNKINYPTNFLLIKPIIYDYLIKLIGFEDQLFKKNNYYEDVSIYSILFSGNQIYLKNIKEKSTIIYVGEILNNENKNIYAINEDINISYILIYNSKKEFIKEYNLFIKNNDILNYIIKRKLKINMNQTKEIITEQKEQIGYFINLKNNDDLIIENDDIDNKYENNSLETIDIAFNNNLIDDDNNKLNDIDINQENNDISLNKENYKNEIIKDLILKDDNDPIIENNKNDNIKDLILKDDNDQIIENDKNNNENNLLQKVDNVHDLIEKNDNDSIVEKNNNNDIDLIRKSNNNLIIEINKNEDDLKNEDKNNNNGNNLIMEKNENYNNDNNDLIKKENNDLIIENNKNEENLEKINKNNENENDLIIENNKNEENLEKINENKENENDLIIENNKNEENLDKINKYNENENDLIIENEEKEENIKNKENQKPILVGLKNINNDSYVNSVLHCLYNLQELTNYFISNNDIKNDKNKLNKNRLSYKYYEVIYHLYYKTQDSKIINSYSPNNFLEYIQNFGQMNSNMNKIKDPQALFIFIISKLKKELNKEENLKDIDNLVLNIDNSILTNVDNSLLLYKKYLNDFKYINNSIIDNYFSGIKAKIVSCQKCQHYDYRFESFYYLTFPLPDILKNNKDREKITLDKCFEQKYSKEKSIMRNFSEKCQNCGQMTNLLYSNQIFLSPKILVIILDDVAKQKNYLKLSLKLDINEYLIEKNNKYELIGIITYFKEIGTNEQYLSYCKIQENGKWYCCCDDSIYDIESDNPEKDMEDKSRWPYILFYNEITINKSGHLITE